LYLFFLVNLVFTVDLVSYLTLAKKTVQSKETRHLQRALRHAFATSRKKWTPEILSRLVREQLPPSANNQQLLALLRAAVHLLSCLLWRLEGELKTVVV
jgi:hypothetical protein